MIILGLNGLAGAGKSTAARILARDFGLHTVPFAGPLKRMAAEYGLTPEEMSAGKEFPFERTLPDLDHAMAQRMLIAMGVPAIALYIEADKPRVYLDGKSPAYARDALVEWWNLFSPRISTPRQFLQMIGTEWGRGMIAPNLWLRTWELDCGAIQKEFNPNGFVADDCRFINEARLIHDLGGRVVEIKREGAGSATGANHASEKPLPAAEIDISIWNDGPEDTLRARLGGILDRYFAQEAI